MFYSIEAVVPVIVGEAEIAVDSVAVGSPVSLEEDFWKIENPWDITDIARNFLSFCNLKDLRATAALSVELRVASEEAKRDMHIISLNEGASEEYLKNPEYRDSFRNMKPVQLNLDICGTRKFKDILMSLNAVEQTVITIYQFDLDEYEHLPFRQVNVKLYLPCPPTVFENLREFTNLGKITIIDDERNSEDLYIDLRARVLELVNGDVSRIHGMVIRDGDFGGSEFIQRVQRMSSSFGTFEIDISNINEIWDLSLLTFPNLVYLALDSYDGVFDSPNLLNVKNLRLGVSNFSTLSYIPKNFTNLQEFYLHLDWNVKGQLKIVFPQLNLPHLQYLEIYRFQMLSLDFILSMPKLEILKISLPSQPIQISPKVAERLAKIKVLEIKRDRKVLGKPKICQSLKDLVF